MALTWMIIFLVLLFIELVTVNLVSIWFAVGALAAFISTYFIDSVTIQILIFIVVSSISLILTKKIVKKITTIRGKLKNAFCRCKRDTERQQRIFWNEYIPGMYSRLHLL